MARKEMIDFITNTAMDLTQVPLSKKCGKYFNLMYDSDNCIRVESFEGDNAYDFINLNDLPDTVIKDIYEDLIVDFN